MYSRAHAALGAVVSVLWIGLFQPPTPAVAVLAYGVTVSVLIDLDHFLVARLQTGDWTHLRRVLANPTQIVWEQSWLFDDVELERSRLTSHVVLGTVFVAGLWPIFPESAFFTAVLLAVHIGADVLRDAGIA